MVGYTNQLKKPSPPLKKPWHSQSKSLWDDSHLFNAYRHSQDKLLFREMVLRLFETKLKQKNGYAEEKNT
jgi:hypothetical protein